MKEDDEFGGNQILVRSDKANTGTIMVSSDDNHLDFCKLEAKAVNPIVSYTFHR